ncbi:hypothetical protein RHE_PF00103 (plasmid) [Rhizobium etli CFN 42]|uniref:Thiaminase-2/PQQC domain-containing protein n=1 Tax=Rhizobium etli (strain ATCC 51251 / DSM 11541 / JCM 21823 / NBRC 15573 / CFN 42) TaxID=347834 RepID=Q2JZJ0_RHIEC|nr:hypothetical protein [Rhizobium etli]ABC93996.1 hypothetical protein RHE_PF00103 [Rhizobium etli CFN 42]
MLNIERPRLRHCTLIDEPTSNKTVLVVGKDYFVLERTDGHRDDLLKLKSLLDGRHTLAQIQQKTGISLADIEQVVKEFQGAGLLQVRSDAPWISVPEFLEKIEATSIMWRRQIGLHRIFAGLTKGDYRREVFLGLLIETYHYVYLLPRTLLSLSQLMRPTRFQGVVAEYAHEEMDHYIAYREALSTVAEIGNSLSTSHPTVGTLSLIRNFESIGRKSDLSLVCCLQLIEARKAEVSEAESNLRSIADRYKLPELVEAFIDHMKADIDLGHSNLLSDALQGTEHIDAAAAHDAVNDMHDIKHCFDAFHESVLGYYRDISNYIPRPKVDYFAL